MIDVFSELFHLVIHYWVQEHHPGAVISADSFAPVKPSAGAFVLIDLLFVGDLLPPEKRQSESCHVARLAHRIQRFVVRLGRRIRPLFVVVVVVAAEGEPVLRNLALKDPVAWEQVIQKVVVLVVHKGCPRNDAEFESAHAATSLVRGLKAVLAVTLNYYSTTVVATPEMSLVQELGIALR
jgi:hypothetical protein